MSLQIQHKHYMKFPKLPVANKESYKGLTYDYMRNYIITHENEENVGEGLAELEDKIFSTFDDALNIKQDATPELKGLFASLRETEKSLKIKVDKLISSDDNNFYLYCNNTSYLNPIYKTLNINITINSYLYSKQAKKLYNYLINIAHYDSSVVCF